MNSPEATIILKSPGGSWTSVGTETSRGIVPEGITVTTNEFGPDTCSFSLRREASVPWPDLLAFNQADVLIGGTLLWGGRIWEAPLSDGDEDVIAVNGRGWQYHLDDDQLQRMYVHTNLGDYVNQRDKPTANLTIHRPAPSVQSGQGALVLSFAAGYGVILGEAICATLDLGSALANRVVVTWTRTFGISDPDDTIYSRGSNSEDATVAGDDANSVLTSSGGTLTHTFTVPRRYHHIMLLRTGASGTFGAVDVGVRITAVNLFGSTAYESGGASVLKASQVVADVLASGALPLLDTSTSNIGTTTFSIPELAPSGYQTPRSIMAGANAYEGNLFGVDAERRVFLRERGTYPSVEVGSWPGASFQDASTNSADGLYNKVIVQGTGPDGAPLAVTRTATSSLLTRQGFTRTAVLSVESAITTTAAQQLGDIWLEERADPPLKGSLVVSQGGARYLNGGEVHPSELMLRGGQLIRLGQLVDPTTGDQGRDGIIKSVSYAHDTETATLELDSERGRLETLLSRLAVVTSQIR